MSTQQATAPARSLICPGRPAPREGRVRKPLLHVVASLGLLVMSAPFLWMALSAFKTKKDLTASPPVWIPSTWTLQNFTDLLDQLDMPRYYFLNSLIVAVLVTVMQSAVLLDARLCAGEAELQRPLEGLRRGARRPDGAAAS